ncbi:MAG TPA: hotdog domain-containing protein, partial [Bacteroidia bacterium]|nr:hotdog domain-containing protein [Bacteroidia bacterium]
MKPKFARESLTINTEVVLPNDTNHVGNLFGGKLMQWVDISAAIAAQRHCGRVVVTASINHVSFDNPIKQNSI